MRRDGAVLVSRFPPVCRRKVGLVFHRYGEEAEWWVTKRPPTPTWQIISRLVGLLIVLTVLVGWWRGRNISDPGVLALLGIASWMLGVNVYATLRRNGGVPGKSSGSSEKPSPSPPPLPSSEQD